MTSDAGDFYWGMLGPEEFEGPMSALAMAHGCLYQKPREGLFLYVLSPLGLRAIPGGEKTVTNTMSKMYRKKKRDAGPIN